MHADTTQVQFSIKEQLLHRNVQRLRGGLVFKAHILLYHSTVCMRGVCTSCGKFGTHLCSEVSVFRGPAQPASALVGQLPGEQGTPYNGFSASQGQNLALTVVYVPCSLDGGGRSHRFIPSARAPSLLSRTLHPLRFEVSKRL